MYRPKLLIALTLGLLGTIGCSSNSAFGDAIFDTSTDTADSDTVADTDTVDPTSPDWRWFSLNAELFLMDEVVDLAQSTVTIALWDRPAAVTACGGALMPLSAETFDPEPSNADAAAKEANGGADEPPAPDSPLVWWRLTLPATPGCADLPTQVDIGVGRWQSALDPAAAQQATPLDSESLNAAYWRTPIGTTTFVYGWSSHATAPVATERPLADGAWAVHALHLLPL